MRTGDYGQCDQVRLQSVTDALLAIFKTYHMVGEQSSIYQTDGEYILPIKRLTKVFRRQDNPPIPELEVSKEGQEMAQHLAYLTGNPKVQATGYLSTIELYHLLRKGEYKKVRKVKKNEKIVIAKNTTVQS